MPDDAVLRYCPGLPVAPPEETGDVSDTGEPETAFPRLDPHHGDHGAARSAQGPVQILHQRFGQTFLRSGELRPGGLRSFGGSQPMAQSVTHQQQRGAPFSHAYGPGIAADHLSDARKTYGTEFQTGQVRGRPIAGGTDAADDGGAKA